jgi:hypothetical protein
MALYNDAFYPDPNNPQPMLDPRQVAAARRARILRLQAAGVVAPEDDVSFGADDEAAPDETGLDVSDPNVPGPSGPVAPPDTNMLDVLRAGTQDPTKAGMTARAQALMGTEMPQGRQVGPVYVASSPLEMASASIGRMLGARLQKKAAMPGEDVRTRVAQAALGLPEDQQIQALLLSNDPGLQRAGAALAQRQSVAAGQALREKLAAQRATAQAAKDEAVQKALTDRQMVSINAMNERARLGRTAAQRRAETMAAGGKPPTASEQIALQRVGQSTNAFDSAFLAGFPSPEPIKGTAENVGVFVAGHGAPGLVPEGVAARSSAWSDVADAIKRIRTGANMPNAEDWKLNSELIPLGGEPKWLHIDKTHRMVKHLESGLDGARTPEADAARERLAELDAQLPTNEAEYDLFNAQAARLRAARTGGAPRPGFGAAGFAPAQAPAGTLAPGETTGPKQIKSIEEYNTLPAGTKYVDPNGVVRTKRQ